MSPTSPTQESDHPVKPTLENVWVNNVKHCDEIECDNCTDHLQLPETPLCPEEHDCDGTPEDCPAAARVLVYLQIEYNELVESLDHE